MLWHVLHPVVRIVFTRIYIGSWAIAGSERREIRDEKSTSKQSHRKPIHISEMKVPWVAVQIDHAQDAGSCRLETPRDNELAVSQCLLPSAILPFSRKPQRGDQHREVSLSPTKDAVPHGQDGITHPPCFPIYRTPSLANSQGNILRPNKADRIMRCPACRLVSFRGLPSKSG